MTRTLQDLAAILRARPQPKRLVCPHCRGDQLTGLYVCAGCGFAFESLAALVLAEPGETR
jgi:hypothetical protein